MRPGKGSQIEDLVNTNQIPDLIYTWNGMLAPFITLDLVMDQTPLIKAHRMDMSRFDKQIVDTVTYDKGILAIPFYNILPQLNELPPGSLNWDIVQFPSYRETPNTYQAVNEHIIFVAKSSKYKDDAFKVLQTVTDDDDQLLAAKQTGRLTPLAKSDIRSALGDYSALKGRNYQGILKSKFAPAPVLSDYEADTNNIVNKAFADYLSGTKDVNTALREADDQINAFLSTK